MSIIEYSDLQRTINNYNSYAPVLPEQPEYDQSAFNALARQMNTGIAFANRERINQQVYDVSRYQGFDPTKPEIRKQLEAQGVDPRVVDEVVASNVNSWQEVEARRTYLEGYYRDQQQISETFSTAESLLIGLPLAVVDPTMLLTGPIGAGVGKVAQVTNFATKMGRAAPVIQYGAVGALEAMADNAIYEQVTGVHEDNSMVSAALIGMALGGTVGLFSSRAAQQEGLVTMSDSSGRLLNPREVQEVQLGEAMQKLEAAEAFGRELTATEQRIAKTDAEIKASRAADRTATGEARVATADELQSQVNGLTATGKANDGVIRTLTNEIKTEQTSITRAANQIESLNNSSRLIDQKAISAERAQEAINFRKQFPDGMPTKTEYINAKVAEYKASGDTSRSIESIRKEAQSQFAQLKRRVSEFTEPTQQLRARVALTNREITRLQNKLNKIAPPEEFASTMREMQRMLDNSRQNTLLKTQTRDSLVETNKGIRKTVQENNALIKELRKVVRDKDIQLSDRTVKLGDLLDQYKAEASPDGLRRLANKYPLIKEDIDKMLNGDFKGLSDAYGIVKQQRTFVTKLRDELDNIDRYRDNMAESPDFKQLPSWARKFLISPIEKLFASANIDVRGLAAKLHAGTLHHGKANTLNAYNRRKMLDAEHNRMIKNVQYDYAEAIKDGTFKGNLDEYYDQVGREAFRVTGATQRAAYAENYAGDIPWGERLKNAEKNIAGYKRQFTTENTHIRRSVDSVLGYYEGIHAKGSRLNMEAFMGSLSKGYMNRLYSKEAIDKIGRDVAIKRLVEAQEKFAIATNKPWGAVEAADALEMATKAIDASLDPAARAKAITQELGVQQAAGTSVFKQRTIEAFDDDLIDLLETNIDGLSTMYGFKTHGRIALQQSIGTYKDAELEALIRATGANPKELDQFRLIIETIKGIREIDKNPAAFTSRVTKGLSSYSSLMHSMAFGVSSFTEIASVVSEFGLGKTLNNLIGAPKDVYRMYKYGAPSEKNQIELLVNYGDAHFSNRANRYDADTGFDSVGRVQAFLDKTNHYGSVLGGLLPVTDALRMTTASLSVDFLARMSVKSNISSTDMKRVLDMGFDADGLARIRDALKVTPDGRITNMDRSTWGTKLDEEINAGVQTMLDRVILEPSGATLPAFMTDMSGGAFVPRILTKFMRFPIESIERMAYRGMQEMDAKRAIGFATNVAMWAGILAAKDALRSEDKQIYANDERYKLLLKDAFLYSSMVGGVATVADVVSGALTGQNITNDYSHRWGGVVVSDIGKLQRGDPTLSLPLYNLRIGETFGMAVKTVGMIEETNK